MQATPKAKAKKPAAKKRKSKDEWVVSDDDDY